MYYLDILAAQLLNSTTSRPLTLGSCDSLPTRTWWKEISMVMRRAWSCSVSNLIVLMSRSLTPLPSEPWRLTAGLALPDMSCSLYRVFSLPDPETIPQNGMVLYCTFPKQSPPTPVSYMLRRSLGRVPRIRPDPGTRSPGMVGAQDTVAVLVNTVAWFGSHTVAALVKAPLRYGNPCWCRAVRGAGAAPARA